jgi:hypothetical protein
LGPPAYDAIGLGLFDLDLWSHSHLSHLLNLPSMYSVKRPQRFMVSVLTLIIYGELTVLSEGRFA